MILHNLKKSVQLIVAYPELEEKWHVNFPIQYIHCVMNHDSGGLEVLDENGEWKDALIPIPEYGCSTMYLLSYINIAYDNINDIEMTYEANLDILPTGVYPFAQSGGGDIFFFDYRKDNNPSIVFMNHERAISKGDLTEKDIQEKSLDNWLDDNLVVICDSFNELLNRAYPADY